MKFKSLILAGSFLLSSNLLAKSIVETKSFSLETIESMDFDFAHMDVEVTTGDAQKAILTLTHTFSGDLSDKCKMVLQGGPKGNRLAVTADYLESSFSRRCDVKRQLKIQLGDVASGNLKFDLRHGDLEWPKVRLAKLNLDVKHGEIQLQDTSVSDLNIENKHGELSLGTVTFKKAVIDMAHGDSKADKISGENFQLETSHGDFKAKSVAVGSFNGENSHGDIEIDSLNGKSTRIEAAHGDVEIEGKLNDLYVESQHGDISYQGSVTSKTEISSAHGPIKLNGTFAQVILDGSHSSIRLDQKKEVKGLNIDAKTNHNDIDIILPKSTVAALDLKADDIEVQDGKGRQTYRKGHVTNSSSGSKIAARSSHGDITVNLRN